MDSTHGPAGRRKLISTSGLILTLLLLFLPFAGVSCESGMGSVSAEISGWDMAVGGEPSVSTTGLFSMSTPSDSDIDSVPVQPLMVLTVVAILSAILFGSIFRTAFARAIGAGGAAGLATLLVISNQIKVTGDMIEEIARDMEGTSGIAADWVGSRVGFWLTLGVLLLMTAYHVAGAAASRWAGGAQTGGQMIRPGSPYPPPYSADGGEGRPQA
ncbi:MAG: hypothetical protein ACRDT0_07660 [Pseudonocardiaceae bacterium]